MTDDDVEYQVPRVNTTLLTILDIRHSTINSNAIIPE